MQRWWVKLLKYLKSKYPIDLHFHDTSASGLTNPYAKIDVTVTPSTTTSSPTWTEVVILFELKASLRGSSDYLTAVGQVIDRCYEIFRRQHNRSYVIAAVVGADEIDFLQINPKNDIIHTGRLRLALVHNNPGIDRLIRLLCSPLDSLFYKLPVLPPPLRSVTTHMEYSNFQLLHSHISPSQNARSPRGSEVYACSSGAEDGAPRDMVIKFNGMMDVHNESNILKELHGIQCPHIPDLVDFGTSPVEFLPQFHNYLVVKPRGEHLSVLTPVDLICSVFSHVCDTIAFAYEHGRMLLHRDISFGNIVYYEHKGLLIDWHVAARHDPDRVPGEHSITGTLMFTSPFLVGPDHVHDLNDDLISLFFVLLFVASGEKLPWRHDLGRGDRVYDRKIALLKDEISFMNALKGCREQMKPVLTAVRSQVNGDSVVVSGHSDVQVQRVKCVQQMLHDYAAQFAANIS